MLFCETSQSLYALNTAAAYLWCRLEEGLDPAALAEAMARELSVEPAAARRQVEQALAQWREIGALAGYERPAPPRPAPTPADPLAGRRLRPDAPVAEAWTCRLLGTRVRLSFETAEDAAWVRPVLGCLADSTDAPAGAALHVAREHGRLLLYRDGESVLSCAGPQGLAPLVKGLVLQAGVNGHRYLFYLHAGVVGDEAGCLLLPAPAGSGKTTLVAGLVHAGLRYFSDEVALLEGEGLLVRPVPLALCVKTAGLATLAPLFPALDGLPTHSREDGKQVRYLPLPEQARAGDAPRPVRALVFPRYSPEGATRLEPLPRVEAVRRLLSECLAIPSALTPANVSGLAAWLRGLRCYSLEHASLPEAVRLVQGALGGLPGAAPADG